MNSWSCCVFIFVAVVLTTPFTLGASSSSDYNNLYRSQRTFSLAMLKAIAKTDTSDENIFFSPYSTYNALLLAYFGSRNETEQELHRALHLNWAADKRDVRQVYSLAKLLRLERSEKMPLQMSFANKIYFNKDIKLCDYMTTEFVDELETMDFSAEPKQCRQEINNWIANVTHDEVRDMLSAGDISAETKLVLANVGYFKSQWADKFDPKDTTREVFRSTRNQQAFVPMMHKRGSYSLTLNEHLGAFVLHMPYLTSSARNSNKLSEIGMVIILPPFEHNSVEQMLSKLTLDTLELALKAGVPREIKLSLPKFEFERNMELMPILRRIGISSIFDSTADLSGFSNEAPQFQFGDAKHVAKLNVDEIGCTAAAVTVFFGSRGNFAEEPTRLECNHPFLFLIYDYSAGAVLFAGIYRKPKSDGSD